eukprot:g3260.t1
MHAAEQGLRTDPEALLRAGLLGLSEAIGTGRLLEFPRRANGTPLLTRQGFFERLLKGETSFLNCAAADASAAEADVKRLALHQLLAIRRGRTGRLEGPVWRGLDQSESWKFW